MGHLQQIMALYYKHGNNMKGDSIRYAYVRSYLPSENDMNNLGYRIIKSNCEKAIEIFYKNMLDYPNSPNNWDSLGDGYLQCKDYKRAINSFEKAVELAELNNDPRISSIQKNLDKAKRLANK